MKFSSEKNAIKTGVPDLLGARDKFCGGYIFHGVGDHDFAHCLDLAHVQMGFHSLAWPGY